MLKAPPNSLQQPSLRYTTRSVCNYCSAVQVLLSHQQMFCILNRKRPVLPRVLAQIDPMDASWVRDKTVAMERLRGQTPISICRPATNVRPMNPTFRIKKSRKQSQSYGFDFNTS